MGAPDPPLCVPLLLSSCPPCRVRVCFPRATTVQLGVRRFVVLQALVRTRRRRVRVCFAWAITAQRGVRRLAVLQALARTRRRSQETPLALTTLTLNSPDEISTTSAVDVKANSGRVHFRNARNTNATTAEGPGIVGNSSGHNPRSTEC